MNYLVRVKLIGRKIEVLCNNEEDAWNFIMENNYQYHEKSVRQLSIQQSEEWLKYFELDDIAKEHYGIG